MFVTAEDFVTPPLDLPNLEGNETFTDFVTQEENELLLKLFGSSFYAAWVAGIAADPIEDRWKQLRDGYTYVYNNKTYSWVGMKQMFKLYIYCRWLEYNAEQTTGVGVVVANTENSTATTPAYKVVRAWNKFVDIVGRAYCENSSLYGFLNNSGTVYADAFSAAEYSSIGLYLHQWFDFPGYKNTFGL